jgi:hypothetical protein
VDLQAGQPLFLQGLAVVAGGEAFASARGQQRVYARQTCLAALDTRDPARFRPVRLCSGEYRLALALALALRSSSHRHASSSMAWP